MRIKYKDKREKFIAFLLALLAAYLLFPPFFDSAVFPIPSTGPSWLSLDPSWQITISTVNINKLIWGKDFVLTYGPLSYLSTRIGWGASRYSFLLFDIFVFANFFIIFYKSYLYSQNKYISVLLIAAATLLLPVFFGAGTSIVLFAFLIFWLIQSLKSNSVFVYFMQAALLLLLFFIKFNTGIVSIILFALCILYKIVYRQSNKFFLAACLLFPFLLVFPLAYALNVSVFSYIRGGLEMVSGYNEIMFLNENYADEFYFALAIIASGLIFLYYYFRSDKSPFLQKLLIVFLYSVSVFVLYKQAFTRMDIQHIMEFYTYFLLLLLSFQIFHLHKLFNGTNAMIIAIVFFTVFFARKREESFLKISARISKADYISGFKNFTDTSGLHIFPNKSNLLPQNISSKIGNSTVDIYPWNTQLLIENKLNFRPRPVFQSYMSYTPYLQKLNFNHYNSAAAPQFVIYDFNAIDNRYPLFDDPKLNLLLLKNYHCADTFSFSGRKQLLLEKNKNSSLLKLQKVKEYTIQISDSIIPQKDYFYEISIYYNLAGKITGIFTHSPEINVIIGTKDSNKHVFRTSKKLLEGGIFSDYFFADTQDLYNFLKQKTFSKPGNLISHISFSPLSRDYFRHQVKVKVFKISE